MFIAFECRNTYTLRIRIIITIVPEFSKICANSCCCMIGNNMSDFTPNTYRADLETKISAYVCMHY